MRNGDSASTAPSTRRSLRWLKFSLGTLMLVVTACCVWLAVKTNAVRRQREAVAIAESLNGRVAYAPGVGQLSQSLTWLRHWLGDDYFQSVDSLTGLRDVDDTLVLKLVAGLPELQEMRISGKFTDAALERIGSLRSLKRLELRSQQITSDGLAHFVALQQLQELHVVGAIESEAVVHLKRLIGLRKLHCCSDFRKAQVTMRLQAPVYLHCADGRLDNVIRYLRKTFNAPLRLDYPEFERHGLPTDQLVSARIHDLPLEAAIDRILAPFELRLLITPDGALITTREKAGPGRKRFAELKAALPQLKEALVDW